MVINMAIPLNFIPPDVNANFFYPSSLKAFKTLEAPLKKGDCKVCFQDIKQYLLSVPGL